MAVMTIRTKVSSATIRELHAWARSLFSATQWANPSMACPIATNHCIGAQCINDSCPETTPTEQQRESLGKQKNKADNSDILPQPRRHVVVRFQKDRA